MVDLENHVVDLYDNDLGIHMGFKVITVCGQPYGFQIQPCSSGSTMDPTALIYYHCTEWYDVEETPVPD
jgi:hypothetical protein